MGAVSSTSVSTGGSSATFVVTSPFILNPVTSPTPSTETSVALPAGLKRFEVSNRGATILQLAFISGNSGSLYRSIAPGASYKEDLISGSAQTLYFQTASPSQRLEVVYWT